MKIGVDLLWVRVGKCGGTESYIRNLLEGFLQFDRENEYILMVTEDNADSFRKYVKEQRMRLKICEIQSENPAKRMLWENLHLDAAAVKSGVDVMFIPVYSKPTTHGSGIPYVSVIHDLQALHYPEYFSVWKRLFLKYAWRKTCKTSELVITISNYGRRDLIQHYPCVKEKAVTIYNPIRTYDSGLAPEAVEEKYHIKRGEFYYCVSSMLPHKNLNTILKVMREETQRKLVISGVGGQEEEVRELLRDYQIENRVVLTGYISDRERDCLYENCRLFLFPSVFEGFGMPPIEAMRRGKRVVMTKKSCLEEVTCSKAIYVEDPFSVEEWKEKIKEALLLPESRETFSEYDPKVIVEQYIGALTGVGE